jgi:hypothetical protein
LIALTGCSGKHLDYADTVEGTLTVDNVPLSGAHIEFIPDLPSASHAPSSSAVTDSDGFFRLIRSDSHLPGAVVASHRVVIFPGRSGGRDRDESPAEGRVEAARPAVPSVYMSAGKTPLQVEVKQDQQRYDLRISRVPAGKR